MRKIKNIYTAQYRPIADLITYNPLPNREIEQIDPFLFLNHHGFQIYPANNRGLPFGPHPHRGMETITFIIEGDIMHKDSEGFQSVIGAGGVQWMTAGSGLIHAETSSIEFKKIGRPIEILQMWVNLPAKYKMIKPNYVGLQKEEIPEIILNENAKLNLISGTFKGVKGAFESLSDIFMSTISIGNGEEIELEVPENRNIFFYVIKGKVTVYEKEVNMRQLVDFQNIGTLLKIKSDTNCQIIYGHALPFNEPMVAQGPFVMNTIAEIEQAYLDYQMGKFGTWQG
jgi:quercetin 2,3-dioxygenase